MLKVKNRVTRSGGRRPQGLVEFRGGKRRKTAAGDGEPVPSAEPGFLCGLL
jgi:hypothetical protein